MQPDISLARIHNWVLNGKPFSDWALWLALDTFSILAEIFSWDSYTPLIQYYYKIPETSDDTQKLDDWAQSYSQYVRTNLCPYFQWFGLALSNQTEYICSQMPSWNQDPLQRFKSKLKAQLLWRGTPGSFVIESVCKRF
jgi:hypothetical protein